jgi:hypothetical protein
MVVRIAGERMYLWRAVDHEGEVLDMLVQRRRDSRAALRLIRKLLKKQGFVPKMLVTDKLPQRGPRRKKVLRGSGRRPAGTDGSQTLRWRKADSNHRSRPQRAELSKPLRVGFVALRRRCSIGPASRSAAARSGSTTICNRAPGWPARFFAWIAPMRPAPNWQKLIIPVSYSASEN